MHTAHQSNCKKYTSILIHKQIKWQESERTCETFHVTFKWFLFFFYWKVFHWEYIWFMKKGRGKQRTKMVETKEIDFTSLLDMSKNSDSLGNVLFRLYRASFANVCLWASFFFNSCLMHSFLVSFFLLSFFTFLFIIHFNFNCQSIFPCL